MQVSTGFAHSCALFGDGGVACWGANEQGQLGLGDTRVRGVLPGDMGSTLARVDLGTGRRATRLAAGSTHTCALLTDGAVLCWGANGRGQLGQGDGRARGDQRNELGDNLFPAALGTDRSAVAVTAGAAFTCVLLDDGTVRCWGSNQYGKLGTGGSGDRGDQPGELGDRLPTVHLGTGRTAVRLAAGADTACAVLDDASVKCWGANTAGALGQGDRRPRGDRAVDLGHALLPVDLGTGAEVAEVTVGDEHVCALLTSGAVKCWGGNGYGQLGIGRPGQRGIRPDDLGDTLPAVALPGGAAAVAIEAGSAHTCAVFPTGGMACWGANAAGALGLGDTRDRGMAAAHLGDNLPLPALGTDRRALAFSLGYRTTCAVLDDETVRCWGDNTVGQLGLGDRRSRGDERNEMGDALPRVSFGPAAAPELTRRVTVTDASGQTAHADLVIRWR